MYVRGLGTILVPSPLFLYVHDKGQIRNIMKRNISNTILTKDYIFSKVSQITIFSTYTGISVEDIQHCICLLYTSPSPRDRSVSRMPSSA